MSSSNPLSPHRPPSNSAPAPADVPWSQLSTPRPRRAVIEATDGSRCAAIASQALTPPTEPPAARPNWQQAREKRYFFAVRAIKDTILEMPSGQRRVRDLSPAEISALDVRSDLQNLLRYLATETTGSASDFRSTHYPALLDELRRLASEILSSQRSSPTERAIVCALCQAHFMFDLDSTQSGKDFVRSLTNGIDARTLLHANELDQCLRASLRHDQEEMGPLKWLQHKIFGSDIKWTDRLRKISANMPLANWDPATYSMRSHLGQITLNAGQRVHLLRMACPVVGQCGNPEIDPLFLGYLKSLGDGKRHLYINNISHSPETDVRRHSTTKRVQVGLENGRAEAIKAIADHPDYSNKLVFISLPHDSDFYQQVDTHQNSDAVEFIGAFVTHLQNNTQGFYLPETENKIELVAKIQRSLLDLWRKFFSEKPTLTLEDRKIFINMAYAEISKLAMEHYGITHANNTCKDGVDRAMGATATLVASLEPKPSPEDLVYLLSMPAVTHHGRPPQLDRTERSTAAVRRYLEA